MEEYLKPLPKNISLQIFNGETLIFQSGGKWLYPLFEFEEFLKHCSPSATPCNLRSHDCAIGKAAAALSVRLGIKKINADLLSENAKNYIEHINLSLGSKPVELTYKKIIPSLLCKTEEILSDITDVNEIYDILKRRAFGKTK